MVQSLCFVVEFRASASLTPIVHPIGLLFGFAVVGEGETPFHLLFGGGEEDEDSCAERSVYLYRPSVRFPAFIVGPCWTKISTIAGFSVFLSFFPLLRRDPVSCFDRFPFVWR